MSSARAHHINCAGEHVTKYVIVFCHYNLRLSVYNYWLYLLVNSNPTNYSVPVKQYSYKAILYHLIINKWNTYIVSNALTACAATPTAHTPTCAQRSVDRMWFSCVPRYQTRVIQKVQSGTVLVHLWRCRILFIKALNDVKTGLSAPEWIS
jgi:hypothetical protein